MCCFGMGFNPFAFTISELKIGDEVVVSGIDHEGNYHEDEKGIVCQISGFSFLTTSGFGFGAGVISELLITGNKIKNAPLSQKALAVMAEIESRKLAEEAGYKPTGELENFDSEPE